MDIEVNHVGEKYRTVSIVINDEVVSTPVLDAKESKELAIKLIAAAQALLT